jgi:hypothetical protein
MYGRHSAVAPKLAYLLFQAWKAASLMPGW